MTTDNNNEPVPDDEQPHLACECCNDALEVSLEFVRHARDRVSARHDVTVALNACGTSTDALLTTVTNLQAFGRVLVLCDDCYECHYTTCTECHTLTHTDEMSEFGYDLYCDSCYCDVICECDRCGQMYHSDGYCDGPHDEDDYDDDEYDGIHGYSYRPAPLFYINLSNVAIREPARTAVTGFELETEAVNCDLYDGVRLAKEIFGDTCYLKSDGSLSNGFEIVSHPMTREYIQSVFPFDDVRRLATLGMRSAQTQTCGLHVHLNKGFFKGRETSFYRFLAMFHRNEEQWKRIAGRTNSSYARWGEGEDQRIIDYTKGLRATNFGYNNQNGNRYVAINIQNSKTVELRFFKGTLRPATLKARIEAVHAVADYSVATRNNVNIKASTDWDKFREFALANNYIAFSEYAELKGV